MCCCDIVQANIDNIDNDHNNVTENVESLWGPIPLARLPAGQDNTCRAVTHG